jgi:NAD+--dinitrogen-reductase ADP-D-ribosyltransferase
MNTDKGNRDKKPATLPRDARLPISRCNLPPQILGSLTFQRHPTELTIDGVATLHRKLFERLDRCSEHDERADIFMDYMVVHFRLHQPEDAGLDETDKRGKADYLRLLRGWLFDADSREAAVLKGWVESRFGLVPRYHRGPLVDQESTAYQGWLAARAEGLYATNALEAQLDLLYSYCQYELARQGLSDKRLTLYRGINQLQSFEVLQQMDKHRATLLLNNLNSFSKSRERAEEFGDMILQTEVPPQKVLFYSTLLPNRNIGEEEYLVIGGVYDVSADYW